MTHEVICQWGNFVIDFNIPTAMQRIQSYKDLLLFLDDKVFYQDLPLPTLTTTELL